MEHPAWLEFFAYMKPTFKPPTRKDLAGKLLDEAYDEMKMKVNEKVEAANSRLSLQVCLYCVHVCRDVAR